MLDLNFNRIISRLTKSNFLDSDCAENIDAAAELINKINNKNTPPSIKDDLRLELLFNIFYLKNHLKTIKTDELLNKWFSALIADIKSQLELSIEERTTNNFSLIVRDKLNNSVIENYKNDIDKTFKSEYNHYLSSLESKVKELDSNIKKQRNDAIKAFHDHELKLSQLFKDNEDSSSNRIQVRLQDAESKINIMTRKFSQEIDDFEELLSAKRNDIIKFSSQMRDEILSSVQESADKNIYDIQEKQSGIIKLFNEKIAKEISGIELKINNEVEKFESKNKSIDALLEKVGLAKDAEVTITQANSELRSANQLRWLGLFIMCSSIVMLIYLFRYYIGIGTPPADLPKLSELGIEFFAIRFMTVILVSSPAIYLLKESASHRSRENLYRQRGTQLLTIRGYLADMPDNQKCEIKDKLASNFFSFHNGKVDTSNVPDFIKNMGEAIQIAKSLNTSLPEINEKKQQSD